MDEKCMKRKFVFDLCNEQQIEINIPEILDPRYGMYTWPAAAVLAQYIVNRRDYIKTKFILELGAGTSLPGILASKLGANVTLSDNSLFPQCIEHSKRSCKENQVLDKVDFVGITWGQYSLALLNLPHVDIVLASDCFYDEKDFEDVLVTVAFILNRYKNSKSWITYQERISDFDIVHLLHKWKLKCCHIPLKMFDAGSSSIGQSHLPGNHTIRMIELTL
ncbi:histone-arginine methyltransferase METTL23-like [Antedon mediterranea]|uniref:histone-arginine methyltransferase METTL23-like n=1 Tax=Antedon mediterranea TaxID=105859 RepID=UPI003AF4C554